MTHPHTPHCAMHRTLSPDERQRVYVAGMGYGMTCSTVTLGSMVMAIGVELVGGEVERFDPALVRALPERQSVPDELPANVVRMTRRVHLVGRY